MSGLRFLLCEHAPSQAKLCIIGSSHCLLLRVKGQDGHDTTKHFLLNHSHVISAVCQDTRTDVVTSL